METTVYENKAHVYMASIVMNDNHCDRQRDPRTSGLLGAFPPNGAPKPAVGDYRNGQEANARSLPTWKRYSFGRGYEARRGLSRVSMY